MIGAKRAFFDRHALQLVESTVQQNVVPVSAHTTLEEMRTYMGADSLAFLSVDGIYKAMGYEGRDSAHPQFTDHCFTGEYPTRLRDREGPPQQKQLSFLAEVG